MDDLVRYLESVREDTFSIVYQVQSQSHSRIESSMALLQKSAAIIAESERLLEEHRSVLTSRDTP